jgi:hypothetical protein
MGDWEWAGQMRIVSAHFYFSIVGEDGWLAMLLLRYVPGLIRDSGMMVATDTRRIRVISGGIMKGGCYASQMEVVWLN